MPSTKAVEEDLVAHVGRRIRELRQAFNGGEGISQERLATELGVQANTVSRWETAQYQPDLRDLDRLSRFFGVSILELFPGQPPRQDEQVSALLRAIGDLPQSDRDELRRFAEFRRAQALYPKGKPRPGRKAASPRTEKA